MFGEADLRRVLKNHDSYYNRVRTHRSLDKDAPEFRHPQRVGNILELPLLGGLHHHYGKHGDLPLFYEYFTATQDAGLERSTKPGGQRWLLDASIGPRKRSCGSSIKRRKHYLLPRLSVRQ